MAIKNQRELWTHPYISNIYLVFICRREYNQQLSNNQSVYTSRDQCSDRIYSRSWILRKLIQTELIYNIVVIRNLSWLLEKRRIIFFQSVQLRTKNSKGFFNITDHQGFIAGIVLPCSMHIRVAIQELALAIRPIKLCCSSSEHSLKVFMKQ